MIRSFKLLAYSKATDKLLSEYQMDRVTQVSGLGFKQKVTVQETDTVDYVVKQIMEKKLVKLQVHFIEPQSYAQAEAFQNWLGAYVNLNKFKLTLQYTNGLHERLVDVYISDYELISLEANVTSVQLSVKPLTPNYLRNRKIVTISNSDSNKKYPYTYPYKYGGGSFSDNVIKNDFIANIPLSVTFRGKIVNPEMSLTDSDGNIYATIKFRGITLQAGQKLVVDGINQRITLYSSEDAVSGTDYFNEIDKTTDTFLMAIPGVSNIIANLDGTEPTNPSVEVSYVQYVI